MKINLLINKVPFKFKELAKYFLFYFYKEKNILKKNISLKDYGRNRRAFLIATGPSIKELDLTLLKDEDCFTLSNAYLHDRIDIINPIFHFFAPFHKPLIKENFISWLKDADDKLPESTKIFLGHKSKDMVTENNIFNRREVNYMYLGSPFYNKISLLKQTPSPKTGTQMVLNLLIYMGYEEIYLIGCDHNILKSYGGVREHFYDSSKELRKNVENWGDITENLKSELDMFSIYKKYVKLAKKRNIRIVNLSRDSWLNFVEYKKFEDVL
jgi:hypothetical protein